jgi:hypothetical protein
MRFLMILTIYGYSLPALFDKLSYFNQPNAQCQYVIL